MSDLIADVMSANAASSASAAATAAKAAKAAAEEQLEGSGHNPFISFADRNLDTCLPSGSGFFASMFNIGSKEKLSDVVTTYSIKMTDISHMTGGVDGFGTPYTEIHLEERCNLQDDGISILIVSGTIEETEKYIASKVKEFYENR